MYVKRTVLVVIGLLFATGATAQAQGWPDGNSPPPRQMKGPEIKVVVKKPADEKPSASAKRPARVAQKPKKKDQEIPVVIDMSKPEPDPDGTLETTPDPPPPAAPLPAVPDVTLTPPEILKRSADASPDAGAPVPPEPTPPPPTVASQPPPALTSPEPEKAKEEEPIWGKQKFAVPYVLAGGMGGFSPEGKQRFQVGRTGSWGGVSGNVEINETGCDRNKQGIPRACWIIDYRSDASLDSPTQALVLRELFIGPRLQYGLFGSFLRFGQEADIGETGTLYGFIPGSLADARAAGLRDTFGTPGMSLILGFYLGQYAMIRAEGNPDKDFYAARLNLHYGAFYADVGYRTATDEMGNIAKAGIGIRPNFAMKFDVASADGKPSILDLGVLSPALLFLCERQSELVPTDKVGKIVGDMHNVCVGQAALSWFGVTALYSYGRYFPTSLKGGGLSAGHIEYKIGVKKFNLSIIPFGAVGYMQGLQVYKLPLLTPENTRAFPVFEAGVRLVFGQVVQPDFTWLKK